MGIWVNTTDKWWFIDDVDYTTQCLLGFLIIQERDFEHCSTRSGRLGIPPLWWKKSCSTLDRNTITKWCYKPPINIINWWNSSTAGHALVLLRSTFTLSQIDGDGNCQCMETSPIELHLEDLRMSLYRDRKEFRLRPMIYFWRNRQVFPKRFFLTQPKQHLKICGSHPVFSASFLGRFSVSGWWCGTFFIFPISWE